MAIEQPTEKTKVVRLTPRTTWGQGFALRLFSMLNIDADFHGFHP